MKKNNIVLALTVLMIAYLFAYIVGSGDRISSVMVSAMTVSDTFYEERFVTEKEIMVGGLVPWELIDSQKTSNLVPSEEDRLVPLEKVIIENNTELEATEPEPVHDINANIDGKHHSLREFRYMGEYYDSSGFRFTYYSETVLRGGGLTIEGRHVNDEGYVCDKDGYICLASKDFKKGIIVKIPFGNGYGKVYDECDVYGTFDVYIH